MTRLNVYAGPAGFFIVRGGPEGDDAVLDSRTGGAAILPGPAPRENDKFPPNKTYYESPIAIQDRSFNVNGSLFYPDTRAFFDGITGPYIPESDISPIWNPEFFGNTMMVNGNTWPYPEGGATPLSLPFPQRVPVAVPDPRLHEIAGVEVWQIGNEGGFLAAPVNLTGVNGNRLLMGPAERADLIVDFTNVPAGDHVLRNVGPDEPFGGGDPGIDFEQADPDSTGQVMAFRVVPRWPPIRRRPAIPAAPDDHAAHGRPTRPLALSSALEEMRREFEDAPAEARLGTVEGDPNARRRIKWTSEVGGPSDREPSGRATEVWEFYNATADAQPMHIHEVAVPSGGPAGHRRRREEITIRVDESSEPVSRRNRGKTASRTRSSPTPARSPASGAVRARRVSSSGIATSSSTRTTR